MLSVSAQIIGLLLIGLVSIYVSGAPEPGNELDLEPTALLGDRSAVLGFRPAR